jgi:hypothetical protein
MIAEARQAGLTLPPWLAALEESMKRDVEHRHDPKTCTSCAWSKVGAIIDKIEAARPKERKPW